MLNIDNDPLDVITLAGELVDRVYAKHPLFIEANKIMDTASEMQRWQPDELIRVAGRLSAINASLGDVISRAVGAANSAYIYRKFQRVWHFTALSKEFTKYDRDNIADKETEEYMINEAILRCAVDTLKARFDSYVKFVSLIQTRIGILKNEMYQSTLGNEENQRRG